MKKTDLYWLAGLLEGEGNFGFSGTSPVIRLLMTDQDVVRRASLLMGSSEPKSYTTTKGGKATYYTGLSGAKRMKSLLRKLLPIMGTRRRTEIQAQLATCNRMEDDYISGFQKVVLVKHLVMKCGLSRAELSRRTGISDSVISSAIRGRTKRMGSLGAYWNA